MGVHDDKIRVAADVDLIFVFDQVGKDFQNSC